MHTFAPFPEEEKPFSEEEKTSAIAITIIYLFDEMKGEKSMQSMIIII